MTDIEGASCDSNAVGREAEYHKAYCYFILRIQCSIIGY